MKIRADFIKLGKNLHTWTGIIAGIFLFICFFAGGLSMFQHHLSQWATPPQQKMAAIEPQQYQSLVTQILEKYPEANKQLTISINSLEGHNAPAFWQVAHNDDNRHGVIDIAQNTMMASLNQNGKLLVREENLSKLGWLIEQLHETAGIPGTLGHEAIGVLLMGVIAVLYFLAIMTGLVVLLPTLIKDFFAIRGGKNKKRFWLDTHNVIGISSLPFHIIISISVIVFAFHDLFYGALMVGIGKNNTLFEPPAPMQFADPAPKLNMDKIFANIQQAAPNYRIDGMRLSNLDKPERANAFVAISHPDTMGRGDNFEYMMFNPYQDTPYSSDSLSINDSAIAAFVRSMFALHFGVYGGEPVRWIYVLFGLGGAYLFYSGNILWIETRLRKQKNLNLPQPQQRKDVVFMANLTIGACLGCMLAIFSSMLIGRWSYVIAPQLSSHNHVFMYVYYIIFIASIIHSFTVGAAKALPQISLAIAIILVLIPLTSILAYLLPINGLWYSSGVLVIIDIVALVFALFFLRCYQKAQDRAISSPAGSIWSIQK